MARTQSVVNAVSPVIRQSLASAVAEKVRERIIRGELHEGEQLRQDALASELDVSRIPVREAFRQLEAEGLITIIANRGAVVSALSPEEIEELFELRALVECHVLRQAIPNMTEDDLRKAAEVLAKYEEAVEHDEDMRHWGEWNWQFHSSLYAPAQRPTMMALIKTLNNNCDRYTRMHLLFTRGLHQTGKAHAQLLEACRSKDPQVAVDVLWKHITEAGHYLREFIRSRREENQ
jgi:DNA-binding GntR family transcriptional regulator